MPHITRIEIIEERTGDYTRLDREMSLRGFNGSVQSFRKGDFRLPRGTYIVDNDGLSPSEVCDLAVKSAAHIGRKCRVITAVYSEAAMRNLEPLETPKLRAGTIPG